MRYIDPDAPRAFRAPFSPLVPLLGIVSCLMLMLSLPAENWWRLLIWLLIGFAIYFGYGRRHSLLEAKGVLPSPGSRPVGREEQAV